MSTIDLQTLTGPEIDSRPARGSRGKIAKWLSARLAPYRHLSGRQPAAFVVASLARSQDNPHRGHIGPLATNPVVFAMDFSRGRDDSRSTSNEARS
ncbi:hypothetical protein [Mesorhizobium sp. Root102]|uniref:hypothetical protein n=1 Tax=Mesorhizobium sp. Root102 TaxID=1736422 RepID=UPI001AECBA95|nr:hypothetical protein [Mesorhizobium sp. Root102]